MSSVIIASNPLASKTSNYINKYQQAVNQSVERISSGKKINSASDSPSETGYISRLRSAIMSYRKLNDNLQDSISMLQTADSAMSGTSGILSVLQTIREKAVQSQNVTLNSQDRQNLQQEVEDLVNELDEIASSTEFNTKKLLNGEMGAKLSGSDSALAGYATDAVESSSYYFTDIAGATKHLVTADNAPAGSASLTNPNYDYTSSLGISGSVTLSTSASTATGEYELIFSNSSDFKVYNNGTGVVTASGSAGTEFSLNGMGITIEDDGTYAEGYKYNFSTTSGSNTLTAIDEGNRGTTAATTLTSAIWGEDAMLNSHFDIKFQYDSGELRYAAFDSSGDRMGSWTASGDEFQAYESSKLNGSKFTFSSADAGIGDTWRVDFANYSALSSAGGTITIGNGDSSFSVSYTGDDRLSDIAASINSSGSGVASASLDTDSGSSIFNIEAAGYGEEGRLSMLDSAGNFVSALGLTEKAGTGEDASLKHEGQIYESASGYFYDIADNIVFEVAHEADLDSGYVSVTDKSMLQYTSANGDGDSVSVFIRDLTASGLGLLSADGRHQLDLTTDNGSQSAIASIDEKMDIVSSEASKVGSLVNSLSTRTGLVSDMYAGFESNLSIHEDTDFPRETANYYAAVAGRDAALAMSAQANLVPSRVLMLLGITDSK
ncbi:flagellin domain protein [Denitrovibrio acetiphilus DSM 12809]|uniref:Flagellin domain protein n=1 Tax=Denitrovibrio acetiphilus (strain DSM 12809 / NBRC 114555 / N2460) TaxID=522772 RepID=D4H5P8_DENA2|nr:flagellin hook IN motif-containing protein [Denitrovibrio acetiphilus]ADD69489.1 flagellin domain protein [Denitrovibrio acetiphilus DSM 12809]